MNYLTINDGVKGVVSSAIGSKYECIILEAGGDIEEVLNSTVSGKNVVYIIPSSLANAQQIQSCEIFALNINYMLYICSDESIVEVTQDFVKTLSKPENISFQVDGSWYLLDFEDGNFTPSFDKPFVLLNYNVMI